VISEQFAMKGHSEPTSLRNGATFAARCNTFGTYPRIISDVAATNGPRLDEFNRRLEGFEIDVTREEAKHAGRNQ
jgi:hypothetical protein